MPPAPRFLVIEDDPDGQFLVRRALLRRFPAAEVCIFRDASNALAAIQTGLWAGCIVHRSLDMSTFEAVRRLREARAALKIVAMSAGLEEGAALAAGATQYVGYADWHRLAACFDPAPA